MGTHPIFESDFDCLTGMINAYSINALRHNRKWAIALKKSPFNTTTHVDCKADIQKVKFVARDLPILNKWSIKLKNGPEMDSNTRMRIVANTEIDIFSFSSEDKFQDSSNPEIDQNEELYRGIDILLTAHTPQILDSYAEFCRMVGEEFSSLGVEFDGFSNPRLHKDQWELNKSPFIYGRHMDAYEIRTYKKVVHFLYLTGTTRDLILNYIERNVPAGVGIEVKSFKLAQFPSELEKHIGRNYDRLSEEDKHKKQSFLEMDDMKMRKLDIAHYEIRRKPWNPTQKDYEQMEAMGFRRGYRTPATTGKL